MFINSPNVLYHVLFNQDCKNFGARNVCVMTDKHLEKLDCVKTVLQSLDDNKINYKLYSNVRVEPTNQRYVNNIQLFNGSAGNNIQLFNGSEQAIDQNIFPEGTGKDQSVLLSLVVDLGQ
jgi:hypothetical protein